jgi:hypothetical protein
MWKELAGLNAKLAKSAVREVIEFGRERIPRSLLRRASNALPPDSAAYGGE